MKLNKSGFTLFVLTLPLLFNCGRIGICEDDELSLQKKDYTGSQLKTQGYYYGDINSDSSLANIYYLYRNGVFFTSEATDLNYASSGTIAVDTINSFGKEIKSVWGVFVISGSEIEIEQWRSRADGCETTTYEKGIILNDSTFNITLIEHRKNGEVSSKEETNHIFYFKSLKVKPDSINDYI